MESRTKYIANIYVNILKHVDKVHCSNPVLSAVMVSNIACNEVKLLEKIGPGNLICCSSIKHFGNDLISWHLITVNATKPFPGSPF